MYRDGQRLFLELNASRTLLGFAESTFHGFQDVSLLSTGSSKQSESIDAFAQAIMALWLRGMEVNWGQWDDLFAFSNFLSLPEIVRPSNAVSISHELHQFSSEDYKAAWSSALCSEPTSDFSSSGQEHVASQTSAQLSVQGNPLNAVGQHQQAMRRVLDSLDRNTLILLDRMKNDSST